MRLLHLYGGNLYGGVERLLASLAEFAPLAPELEQTFGLCYPGRLWSELEAHAAAVHPLGAVRVSRPWQVWAARRRLRAKLREGRFDAVLCHSWWPYAVFGPAARAAGLPVGLWAHDMATGRGWLQGWARLHRPEMLLACGAFNGSTLGRLFAGVKVERVTPPVPRRPPVMGTRARLRQALHTPPGTVVMLVASRLEPWKGHALLLEALAALTALPGWRVWIAGGAQRPHEVEYLRSLQAQAQDLGLGERIDWLGERTDIADLMTAADFYCQPNTAPEPFGMVFLEALAAGLPVVSTEGGGASEIVTPECGLLTMPLPSAVAAALTELIEDAAAREQLAKRAPLRWHELANPELQMRRFALLMLRLAGRFSSMADAPDGGTAS